MAVLEELGVGVSIQVDEQDLQEWPDPDPPKLEDAGPETKIVSNYIISQDDREYIIRSNFTKECTWIPGDRHVILMEMTIDGNKIRGKTAKETGSAPIRGNTYYNADGTGSLYKFKFSGIETGMHAITTSIEDRYSGLTSASLIVDDASKTRIDNDIEQAKGLGQIVVEIWRDEETGVPCRPRVSQPNIVVQSEIAEKALKGKAISHGTS